MGLMRNGISQIYKDSLAQFISMNIGSDFSIFSENSDPYFIINMSGEIVYTNNACQTFLGYSKKEMMQLELKDICSYTELNRTQTYFLRDDREKLTSFYLQIMKRNKEFIDIDVTCFPIFQNKIVIGTYVVFREAQDLVVQQNKNYSTIMEHSPESIFIVKGRTIVDVSNVALSMVGASHKKQLVGESFYLLLDPDSIENFYKKLVLIEDGGIPDLFEQRMLTIDRQLLDVEIKVLPTIFNGERAFHLIIKDISEYKKLTKISEKQAVAGQLAAGVAHEIRNPITAIKGFLKLIRVEQEKPSSYFSIIESEIERIEVILRELMVLAKPSDLKYERLCIDSVIKKVLTLMESQALLNNIEVEHNLQFSNIDILGDENQLKQVFVNYIKNAIEAMPHGGKLLIEGIQCDQKVCIRIVDEGGGIPPEVQARMGEPFFTTKENGTGLGMIVSSQIIKEHKGNLRILSSCEGTRIEVIFPCYH